MDDPLDIKVGDFYFYLKVTGNYIIINKDENKFLHFYCLKIFGPKFLVQMHTKH